MNPLITLSDNIIGAIVPEDAKEIQVTDAILKKFKEPPCLAYFYNGWHKIPLPSGKWEMIMEVSSEGERPLIEDALEILGIMGIDKSKLYALLASKDIYWVNPDIKPVLEDLCTCNACIDDTIKEREYYKKRLAEWQRKQSIADEMKGNKVVICAKTTTL